MKTSRAIFSLLKWIEQSLTSPANRLLPKINKKHRIEAWRASELEDVFCNRFYLKLESKWWSRLNATKLQLFNIVMKCLRGRNAEMVFQLTWVRFWPRRSQIHSVTSKEDIWDNKKFKNKVTIKKLSTSIVAFGESCNGWCTCLLHRWPGLDSCERQKP